MPNAGNDLLNSLDSANREQREENILIVSENAFLSSEWRLHLVGKGYKVSILNPSEKNQCPELEYTGDPAFTTKRGLLLCPYRTWGPADRKFGYSHDLHGQPDVLPSTLPGGTNYHGKMFS